MSYQSVVEMAGSSSLTRRIAASAATEGQTDPLGWAQSRIWRLAASPGWADGWEYAENVATINVNPDTGIRNDVITDSMILSAVQALRTEENPPPEPEP